MQKDEAVFHAQVMRWLRYNLHQFPKSFLIETKIIRRDKNRFPYRELSIKEERLLLRAKNGTVMQTHSDYGGMGTNCDASVISGGGFIFLKNIKPRNKTFYVVDIEDFINHRGMTGKKSITEDELEIIKYLKCEHK